MKPPAKQRGQVTSLGEALHRLLCSWGVDGKVREQQVALHWPRIVGPRIATHTEALRVEDGTVYVRVGSAPWRTELMFMKKDIIDRLNQEAGREVIKDIFFVCGSGRSDTSQKKTIR